MVFDELKETRMALYRARFLSWKLGRKVMLHSTNRDDYNPHWIHMPMLWVDTGEPVTVPSEQEASR